jgi:hypothetical protein
MSSSIFPNIGQFIGKTFAGSLGGFIGKEFDKEFFGKAKPAKIGLRLKDYTLQTATYGRAIPIIYGTVKLAGNIIWASKISENRENFYQRRSKFGGKHLVASQFNYSISLAIAIAEGEIDEILRVWANDKLVDPKQSNYRFYKGDEEQMPDPLIEAHLGYKKTPAFRGIAYVVIEDLPLHEFGNNIPNFVFEVKKFLRIKATEQEKTLEERINSIVIIPGSGEFVYDTIVQSKIPKNYNPKLGNFNFAKTKINQNNRDNIADSLLALKQLGDACPNLEWVAPVVGWFASSINAGNLKIKPGVEFKNGDTLPDSWQVEKYNRQTAHQISKNKFQSPIYGGTSNDSSIIRYLEALKQKNYKIMFYPMIFVDKIDKPWRGRITGDAAAIKNFFYGDEGYFRFILHYAKLVKGKVDAFIIGSELIGLTKIKDDKNNFPAVEALKELARKVKQILGDEVKISYAADWSEYHHTENGWYNLDSLWASPDIDFVGIDAYFPLTNETENFVGEDKIIKGWSSGEGYDFYYEDAKRTIKKPLQPQYAWKNIEFWWKNEHINPDGKKTAWIPKQKKIWFTELGFPSVDLCSNQPNVFFSPDSKESSFPIHSLGKVDFASQRQALSASEKFWQGSEFLERSFIWTWDARPYPFWPDLNKIWSDGGCWSRGHWLNGKLFQVSLQSIIIDIAQRCMIKTALIKADQLVDFVDGLIVANEETAIEIIDMLKIAYNFDSYEEKNKINFINRRNNNIYTAKLEEVIDENNGFKIFNKDYYSLADNLQVSYFNLLNDYNLATENAVNHGMNSCKKEKIFLPLNLDPQKAQNIAEITLSQIFHSRHRVEFLTSSDYLHLLPNDILQLVAQDKKFMLKVISASIVEKKQVKIIAETVNSDIYKHYPSFDLKQQSILLDKNLFDPDLSEIVFVDIPKFPYQSFDGVYIGVIGKDVHWRGAVVICPDNSILDFDASINYGLIEERSDNKIIVQMFHGELESIAEDEKRMLNYAYIEGEVVQFKNAEFLGGNRYILSNISQEMFSTKKSTGKKFVIIDHNLQKFPIDRQHKNVKHEFFVISKGHNFEQKTKFDFVI